MANLDNSLEGIVDGELELKDEVSGSDSEGSSIQILDEKQTQAEISRESGEYESFVVDIEPEKDESLNKTFQLDESISSTLSYSSVISHHTPVQKEINQGSHRRSGRQSCFNCGATDHPLVRCPKPHDQRVISQNRRSFVRQRESAGARFHDERPERPQPGKVSDRLREALGIGPRELPPWIYRMRQRGLLTGFPPAYRKRATEQTTVRFHMDEDLSGTRKRKHDETEQYQIKPERLVRYPGFNFFAANLTDRDDQAWAIPPWDTFVAAQQAFLDQRRPLTEEEEDSKPPTKRAKTLENPEEQNNKHLEDEEEHSQSEGEDGEEEEDEENVLFVDTRLTTVDVSLEEGEIVDEEEIVVRKNATMRQKRKKQAIKKQLTSRVVVVNKTDGSAAGTSSVSPKDKKQQIDPSSSTNGNLENREKQMDGPKPELGTPVPLNCHLLGNKHDYEIQKPELDKWSQGIQAFQHQAPSKSVGFFKKMHQIIKKVRGDKKSAPNPTGNDSNSEDTNGK